jgi:alpha-L-rhamnosidase
MHGRIVSNWRRENGTLTMEIEIPPNTTATIHVPATDAAVVTESGNALASARAVKFLRMDAGAAVYEVGSGRYTFMSRR